MEAIQELWQENRKFLLLVGGGFSLFLILRSCAVEGLLRSAAAQRAANQKTQGQAMDLRDRVFQGAGEEQKRVEALDQIEKDLRSRFLTPAPQNVPDPRRGAPQIQFSEQIDSIWSGLRQKANQRNVKIPEKITTHDLGVSTSDTPADLERNAAYLEILGRALSACVDQGIQIEKPVLFPEEDGRIQKNDDFLVVYRRVGLTVYGPFESYRRLFREFQAPGSFIQVRLMSLDSKGGSSSALRGQVEFVSLQMLKEGEGDESTGKRKEERPVKKKKRTGRPGRKGGA